MSKRLYVYGLRRSLACGLLGFAASQTEAREIDLQRLQDEAVVRLQGYVQVDTTNPPGNERAAVEWLGNLLREEGIPFETAESAPGRGNLWARLDGGPGRALVLLHHVDVVPADRKYWSSDPFGGELRDGFVHGRGTLDAKGLGIAQLQAFVALHRAGKALRRPVVYLAVADEEAGGAAGTGWLLDKHPEIFADAEWVLNEGGAGFDVSDHVVVNVEVTQKIPLWLRLTARDKAGHASNPRSESSVTRLVHALERISHAEFEPRAIDAVDRYAKARASAGMAKQPEAYSDLRNALLDPGFRERLRDDDPTFSALTRDTCAMTRLSASDKINVIPPEAWAEIDCRLLPDRDPDAFIASLVQLIDDPAIEIKELLRFRPGESSTDTDLFRAIVESTRHSLPGSVVIPSVAAAFTDSHYFRERGIVAYGYAPFVIGLADLAGIHGNDERIPIDELRAGTLRMLDLVQRLVY